MSLPQPGLRKRHVGPTENGQKDAQHATLSAENTRTVTGSHSTKSDDAKEETVWGKTNAGASQSLPDSFANVPISDLYNLQSSECLLHMMF